MMPPQAHSISRAAAQAWRDSIRAMKALWPLTAIAFGICAGFGLLLRVLGLNGPTTTAMDLVWSAVEAFLLTPYFIAVHRFIILNEATRGPWLSPATGFPAWTAVEAIAGGAVNLLVVTIGIAVASRLYQRLGERAA